MSPIPDVAGAFYLPPEWHPHLRCWMAWPCRLELWGDKLAQARMAYAAVARAIAHFEPVTLIVSADQQAEAQTLCSQAATPFEIDYCLFELDDSWLRDTMPLFLVNKAGRCRLLNWDFNGWGERFIPYDRDRMLGKHLLGILKTHGKLIEGEVHPMVLEGGCIEVDGEGTLLAVRQCLLNPNRNRFWLPERIEQELKLNLGIKKVIWLEQGLVGDAHTDGHIDNLACFIEPGRVLLMKTDDESDPNFQVYRHARATLSAATDAMGRKLELVELQQPRARFHQGQRLPLSYINFYRANGGIVMPAFDDPSRDQAAYELFSQIFPRYRIKQVPVLDIVIGGGGIHCISMQQPLSHYL